MNVSFDNEAMLQKQPQVCSMKKGVLKISQNSQEITCNRASFYQSCRPTYLSVFSPNAGKYGSEKTLYLDTFHAVIKKETLTQPLSCEFYKTVHRTSGQLLLLLVNVAFSPFVKLFLRYCVRRYNVYVD